MNTPLVDPRLRILGVWIDPRSTIYATIMMMVTLSLFASENAPITWRMYVLLAIVTVAPLFALSMAHAFSEALDLQIRLQRRLNAHERRHLFIVNVQYMAPSLFVLAYFAICAIIGMHEHTAVRIILGLGTLSMGLWGLYAGYKAHLQPWRVILFGLLYGSLGALIIIVEMYISGSH